MEVPRRESLPHEVPLWVDPQKEIYFITINCNQRLSFPPSGKPFKQVVTKWKEWTAKEIGIVWQRDFFEHRLRHDESRREKANYILANPVRKGLVTRLEDWPFIYFGDGKRPEFER